MNRVQLESPYHGQYQRNSHYLDYCIRDCIVNHGEAPFASHGLYVGALADTDEKERQLGIETGFEYMETCDYVVVYTDFGISSGMRQAINNANKLGKEVVMRKLPDNMMKQFNKWRRVSGI